ncbi:RIP metalloprotease RseP [Staphylococcus pseudintermedius]|uniref:RIP metalloprotease RseP n=1 Tax=Staphylococcus pseudintermedius TaxID=283734 RepID=UPI0001FFAD60|nr:RIP metalloprotease RseP [Staphylococcus pseudintermedius]ADX76778.1 membrane-associated zinc metalloprotease, putative [Staphylococcus pseudintermedius ED99]ANQ82034.1 RIP metalloprotease RseP [Staphylococcus pseudintermedius]EGQ0304475.1 RIP metalloprotease RseP [Staphylococcus pseudintermedius]EGQ0356582.1 RIP metalloprotease RseP [Staphylococcus pseudintermedius]EGQ1703301.1 RIP metalloprotease RseP [Staphylococcus pseudintermedius]
MLITLIAFIIVFGVLVFVHEFGHMYFAKRAGIMCPEFAIGMGPKIFSFRKDETLYTIRLLPVGGYVRMAGDGMEEQPVQPGMHVRIKTNDANEVTHIILDDQHKFQQIEALEVKQVDLTEDLFIEGITADDDARHRFNIAEKAFFVQNGSLIQIAPRHRQFTHKKPYQKFLTLFAGPLFNFILAFVLIIGLAYYEGVPVPKIAQVGEKSPAQQIGLQKGDEIKKIGNHAIHRFNDVKKQLEATEGKPTTIVIERDGKTIEKEFSPKKVEIQTTKTTKQTDYQLGFMPERERSLFEPLLFGIQQTIEYGKIIFVAVASMIASIFTGDFSFDMLNGPVGIYKNVDTVVKTGIINLISWTAVLSVNLGIMNLLPIPALDGGRILFVIYEAIFRKPANKKAETVIIAAGAVFVLIIMVLVTWNDIQRYFL